MGFDNLLVKEGRDVRAWIAFAFGFIHGFGFANVLREMDLPRSALGWSLFSFNLGVEIGQMWSLSDRGVGLVGASGEKRMRPGRKVALAGSIVVIPGGSVLVRAEGVFSARLS